MPNLPVQIRFKMFVMYRVGWVAAACRAAARMRLATVPLICGPPNANAPRDFESVGALSSGGATGQRWAHNPDEVGSTRTLAMLGASRSWPRTRFGAEGVRFRRGRPTYGTDRTDRRGAQGLLSVLSVRSGHVSRAFSGRPDSCF